MNGNYYIWPQMYYLFLKYRYTNKSTSVTRAPELEEDLLYSVQRKFQNGNQYNELNSRYFFIVDAAIY